MDTDADRRLGALYALGAFSLWGIIPIYFKLLGEVGPLEIICHRIAWTVPTILLTKAALGRLGVLRGLIRKPKRIAWLACSAALIAVNWLIFVWAVHHDRVLETSLGYFINPLINVLIGTVLLRERLRPMQVAALVLACAAVALRVVQFGALPWVSLSLAGSFALYGLLRKKIPVDALGGLLTETTLLFPFAMAYLGYLAAQGQSAFTPSAPGLFTLLLLAGPVTMIPLGLFAAGARRIPLSTLGFIQYITPSGQFCLAVFVFHEAFDVTQLFSFVLIWIGLAVFSVDSYRTQRRLRAATAVVVD